MALATSSMRDPVRRATARHGLAEHSAEAMPLRQRPINDGISNEVASRHPHQVIRISGADFRRGAQGVVLELE